MQEAGDAPEGVLFANKAKPKNELAGRGVLRVMAGDKGAGPEMAEGVGDHAQGSFFAQATAPKAAVEMDAGFVDVRLIRLLCPGAKAGDPCMFSSCKEKDRPVLDAPRRLQRAVLVEAVLDLHRGVGATEPSHHVVVLPERQGERQVGVLPGAEAQVLRCKEVRVGDHGGTKVADAARPARERVSSGVRRSSNVWLCR